MVFEIGWGRESRGKPKAASISRFPPKTDANAPQIGASQDIAFE
ncbi:MAG: hypothetical protein AAGM38_06025 [Pseudomonadota bacterium]